MDEEMRAWDEDYRARGRLWAGSARLPEMPAGSRVLEIGCGSGKTLAAAAGKPWRVAALDISEEAVRLCRPCLLADLIAGDARRLPFRTESFHAVLAFHVVGHVLIDDRGRIAGEIARVLKEGGCLFFRDFSTADMRAGRGEVVEKGTRRRGEGIITHYFDEGEVADLFRDLTPVSIKTINWKMRVRGSDLPRSEVEAAFVRRDPGT